MAGAIFPIFAPSGNSYRASCLSSRPIATGSICARAASGSRSSQPSWPATKATRLKASVFERRADRGAVQMKQHPTSTTWRKRRAGPKRHETSARCNGPSGAARSAASGSERSRKIISRLNNARDGPHVSDKDSGRALCSRRHSFHRLARPSWNEPGPQGDVEPW